MSLIPLLGEEIQSDSKVKNEINKIFKALRKPSEFDVAQFKRSLRSLAQAPN